MTDIGAVNRARFTRGSLLASAGLAIAVAISSAATARALNWSLPSQLVAACLAFAMVIGAPTLSLCYALAIAHAPRPTHSFWHICLDKHSRSLKKRVLVGCGATLALTVVAYAAIPAARQWTLVCMALALAALLGYIGLKCCRNKSGKGRIFVAIAAYILSLSVEYLANATSRDETGRLLLSVRRMSEQIKARVDDAHTKLDAQRDTLAIATRELGVRQSIMGAILRELDNGIQIVDLDPTSRTTDDAQFQAILLLAQPQPTLAKSQPRRIELTPSVRLFVERMARNASMIDKHRAAVTLGHFDIADRLASDYEQERTDQRAAEDYAYCHARGDRFWVVTAYSNAATWYKRAAQLRATEPELVIRAVHSLRMDGSRENYRGEVAQALAWLQTCMTATADDSPDRARLLSARAVALHESGSASEAIAAGREAVQRLEAAPGDVAADLWFALGALADILRHAGLLIEAAEIGDRAMAIAMKAHLGPQAIAETAAVRAVILQDLGRYAAADADIATSIAWGEGRGDERFLAGCYAALARAHQDRGELDEAEAEINKAISWSEKQIPVCAAARAVSCTLRARIRLDNDDLGRAAEDVEWCIEWEKSQNPVDERSLHIDYALRAEIRHRGGNVDGAKEDIEASIQWNERQTLPDERALALNYEIRGRILVDLNKNEEAEKDVDRSLAWYYEQEPLDKRMIALLHASRARVRRLRGNVDGAMKDIDLSITNEEGQALPNTRELAIRYDWRARIWQSMGQLPEAENDITKSMELQRSVLPPSERAMAILHVTRARIRLGQMRYAEARADTDVALEWWLGNARDDERVITHLRELRASIDQAENGAGK